MELRKLTQNDCEITLDVLEEYADPADMLISGELEYRDQELQEIENIKSRIRYGDQWAWCTVKVSVKWGTFEGVDYLGGCSYKDENEFRAPGGCYQDMIEEALADLNNKIAATHAAIKTLEV